MENVVMESSFWLALEQMVLENEIKIDRPQGTAHPKFPGFIYPLDYGYIEGTCANDGQEIDVWVGSLQERKVTGIVVTVDNLKKDSEIKVLVSCNEAEKSLIYKTLNENFMKAMMINR
jgi:inorganic pyrophosphatase